MKYTIRKLLLFTMVLVMLLSNLAVFAAMPPEIRPYYDNVDSASVLLVISNNGWASCYGKITLREDVSAQMTVALLKSTDKESWSQVTAWNTSGSATLKIDKGCFVVSGYYYVVELKADIYNSRGIVIENVTEYSEITFY